MSSSVPFGVASAAEIARRQCQPPTTADARVSVANFGKHAKLAWPFKTAAQMAAIANTSERHAARWLNGEFDPPSCVLAALIVEITKRS